MCGESLLNQDQNTSRADGMAMCETCVWPNVIDIICQNHADPRFGDLF